MTPLLISLLAALAVGIGISTLFTRHKVSAYEQSFESTSYVRAKARGWYDRWDRAARTAGYTPPTPTRAGNIPVLIAGASFSVSYIVFGFFIALVLTVGVTFAQWAILSAKGRKRTGDVEPVLLIFLEQLSSRADHLSLREAFITTVDSSSEPLVNTLFGPATANLRSGGSFSVAMHDIAKSTPNEALVDMCATLDEASGRGSRSVGESLRQLRDGISAREDMRRKARAGDTTLKGISRTFTAGLVVLPLLSMLIAPQAWNTPPGFVLAGMLFAGAFTFWQISRRLLVWRMDN